MNSSVFDKSVSDILVGSLIVSAYIAGGRACLGTLQDKQREVTDPHL